jgi:hypothetical protein
MGIGSGRLGLSQSVFLQNQGLASILHAEFLATAITSECILTLAPPHALTTLAWAVPSEGLPRTRQPSELPVLFKDY